jgi:hypothetical protein
MQAVTVALPIPKTVIRPALAVAVLPGDFLAASNPTAVAHAALRVRSALRPVPAT